MGYQVMKEFTILVHVAIPEKDSEEMIEHTLNEYMDRIEGVLPPFNTEMGGLRNVLFKDS